MGMNFIEQFNEGVAGNNIGLFMGKGLEAISLTIGGVQKKRQYAIAAGPKVGKTTLVDNGFVIEPYFDALAKGIEFEVIYFSYEIDRVSKEFDFAAHFFERDYNLTHILLPTGITHKEENRIPISGEYLMGQKQDDSGNPILVAAEIYEKLRTIYEKRIVPMFGEYDADGLQITKGFIIFVELKENPTGIRNKLLAHAEQHGTFSYITSVGSGGTTYTHKDKYKPNNPQKITLVIMDHVRKLIWERGFKMKETIDKYAEYCTEIRNMCSFSFVQIIHLNRSISDVSRMKYADDNLYPTSEDIKDTGNLSEECNYVITMFNPNDDKYHLSKHFNAVIRTPQKKIIYPFMRTIHLVESRHCEYPQHFRVNMKGATKTFEQLKID